jgi:hypothetical protein
MGKSYRKPWGTWVSIKDSAHSDKTTASRMVRRAQEQSLREAIRDEDWDGWLITDRYECSYNDVWGWGRDGKQRPMYRSKQYNNPYAYVMSPTWMDEEQILARWKESMGYDDSVLAYASRK